MGKVKREEQPSAFFMMLIRNVPLRPISESLDIAARCRRFGAAPRGVRHSVEPRSVPAAGAEPQMRRKVRSVLYL